LWVCAFRMDQKTMHRIILACLLGASCLANAAANLDLTSPDGTVVLRFS